MKKPQLPSNETERLNSLREADILDSLPEGVYQEIVETVAEITGTPIGLISLVDTNRQWFKAKVGLDAQETSRDVSFCAHAILGNDIFLIEDTRKDPRFSDNPLVTGNPNIRFYAGQPIILTDGAKVGTLCVIDTKPNKLNNSQKKVLKTLAHHVSLLIDARKKEKVLSRLLAQEESINTELEREKDLRKRFVLALGHDLKTPLTTIKLATEIMLKGPILDDKIKNNITRINRASSTINHLLSELLDSNHYYSVETKLNLSECSLGDELKSIVQDLSLIYDRNVSINIDDVHGFWDSHALNRVFDNLISNAMKYSPDESEIFVNLSQKSYGLIFSVRNYGPVISKGDQENIFKLFSRGPEYKKTKGWGIGLAVVKSIVELHDGRITVESSEGAGTCFTVTIPTPKL